MSKNSLIVEIPFECSRKRKEVSTRMPLSEAEAFAENLAARAAFAEKLSADLSAVPADKLPHLITVYKGKIVILSTVHDSNDDAIKRALNAAIGEDVFDVPPPVKRAPKAPGAADASPDVEIAVDADQ